MLQCCDREAADDEISLASASLITISIIAFSSLIFGLIFGMGLMFTAAMQTADSQTLGFSLIIVGILGFFTTMGITIIRNERKRARVMVNRQGMF
jgi:hypothetical protein